MSATVSSVPKVEVVEEEEWSVAAEKAEKKDAEVDTDDDSGEWTDESDNEDPDGELGRLQWIERTKKDIATAVPHESNPFWNCVICGNQCIGTSFIRFPEKRDLGSPAANAHVFDCAIAFRKQHDYCYDWESKVRFVCFLCQCSTANQKVGVPKAGFDIDGHKIEETPVAADDSKDDI